MELNSFFMTYVLVTGLLMISNKKMYSNLTFLERIYILNGKWLTEYTIILNFVINTYDCRMYECPISN